GERLAGRDLLLVVEDLRALLELGDVGGSLVVGRNRFADLLAVALRGFVELAGLDRRAEDVTEALAERERGARAGRQRHVVRHGSPQRDGRDVGDVARVVQDADDPGRPRVPRALQADALDQPGLGRAAGNGL